MPLGDKLRKLRKERDWTQQQLAEKLGVHGRDITRWEKNKVKPRATTLAKLAEVFDVTVEELTLDNGSLRLDTVIPDPELLTQFQAVSQFSEEERNALKILIQAMIIKNQMRNLVTG